MLSFTPSIHITPHTLLGNLSFSIFNLFLSATPMFQVSAPYSAVSTTIPSYNLLALIPSYLLIRFFYSSTHLSYFLLPFSPHVQTITILSDQLASFPTTPSSLSHLLIPQLIHSCYSTQTSQTPQLPYIQSLPLYYSDTPSLSPIQCCWYYYYLKQSSLGTHSK